MAKLVGCAAMSHAPQLMLNPDRMYAAQQNGDLFGSENAGTNWYKLNVKAPELSDMKAVRA